MRSRWQRIRSTRSFGFVRRFIDEWQEDRCSGMAAEIAFFGLLGVFPTLLVTAATFGWFESWIGSAQAAEAEQWVVDRATDLFGADSEVPMLVADLFESTNAQAFTVGLLLALYTASRGFAAVVRAIDIAYDHPDRRGWLAARAVGLLMALGTVLVGFFVVMLLVVGPLFGSGADVAAEIGAGGAFATVWDWLRWPAALVVLVAYATTVYHVAPNRHTPWRWDLPGAVVAMVLWVLSSWGFGLYLEFASTGPNAVLGLLGGAISMVLWFYVLAMGLLAGAEINGLLSEHHEIGRSRRTPTLRGIVTRVQKGLNDPDHDESETSTAQ